MSRHGQDGAYRDRWRSLSSGLRLGSRNFWRSNSGSRSHENGLLPLPPAIAWLAAAMACVVPGGGVLAQQAEEELARKLANPVSSLISVPLQLNYDERIGPRDEGERWTLNIQPVVPFDVGRDWNLISRTILPLRSQHDVFPGEGSQTGTGDIVQSAFLSPKEPTAGGWIWGAGPVFLVPTGSDALLTADKWGAGPTAVVLRQQAPWTLGVLGNHIWSFAGDDGRPDVSATFIQPFVAYTTPTAWSVTLNTESTYDWETEQWSVPVNVFLAKVTRLGRQPVSLGAGVRYWADSPDGGPEELGFRLQATLLYPR